MTARRSRPGQGGSLQAITELRSTKTGAKPTAEVPIDEALRVAVLVSKLAVCLDAVACFLAEDVLEGATAHSLTRCDVIRTLDRLLVDVQEVDRILARAA